MVAGTIEPDADGDGFGDETQDGCPSQAVSQGACDTTKPGVSGFGVKKGKIAYICTVPGHAAAGMKGKLTVT